MQWAEFRSYIRHLPASDMDRLQQAFVLGKSMHGDQKRRSGEPYFNHPIAVAHMLSDLGADADTLIAALLHDTVEDTPLTLEELDDQFGQSVTALIDGLTKLSSRDVAMSPRLDEQVETLRKIFTLMQEDVRIMVIKLVDRLHNMQTVEFLPPDRQKALAKETKEVFVKIADKLCMQDLRDELEGLCLAVLETDMYDKLAEMRAGNEQRANDVIKNMRDIVLSHDRLLGARMDMAFERKSWDQLKAQYAAGESVVTGLSFVTVAFICDDIDSCYRILGAIHQSWQRETLSFQDFINAPQLNGYRGLHTTAILHDGTRVRCKIRTKEMHTYARIGITTKCFDSKAMGIMKYLPWTERLSPLTDDTKQSSDDFWQNLQSDILGKTIIIHGPGDSTVQLPSGATALDGAFYFLEDKALRTASIKMNGADVPFSTTLTNAAAVEVTLADEETCNREWLRMVQTGFAAAQIHAALGSLPKEQKITIGRSALQEVMTERGKGLLEEFDVRTLLSALKKGDLASLSDAFVAIAEGRRKPLEIFELLFDPTQPRRSLQRSQRYVIRFTFSKNTIEHLQELMALTRKYSVEWRSIRMRETDEHILRFSLTTNSSRRDIVMFEQDLIQTGARDVEWYVRTQRENFLIASVILLWALNPVIASWFLREGMNPSTLMTIRFLTIAAFMSGFFVIWRRMTKQKFVPIPHITLLSLPATLANAALMIYLYALQYLPPSVHLTILRFNTLLLPSVSGSSATNSKRKAFLIFVASLIATIGGLLYSLGNDISIGLVFSVGTLVFYTIYSITTERTLQQHKIDVRYPYFSFHSGLILGVIGLLMLPWQSSATLFTTLTIPAIVYVVCCVCISHLCYSALLKTTRFRHFTDFFLAEIPLAMAFEAVFLGIFLPPAAYLVLVLAIFGLLFARWSSIN